MIQITRFCKLIISCMNNESDNRKLTPVEKARQEYIDQLLSKGVKPEFIAMTLKIMNEQRHTLDFEISYLLPDASNPADETK